MKRSSTAVLVKNIPFSTTEEELTTLFNDAGGPVARVVLPPSKTLALVELVEPSDAKRAFKRLAYKNFKKMPLFLEWAPLAAEAAARQAKPDSVRHFSLSLSLSLSLSPSLSLSLMSRFVRVCFRVLLSHVRSCFGQLKKDGETADDDATDEEEETAQGKPNLAPH